MIIVAILVILIIITGFRSGEKFFILKNTNLDPGNNSIEINIKRWEFGVKIRIGGKEIDLFEKSKN